MLCIVASQWYSLATSGFYSAGASILCPMFAVFILHAGFFANSCMKDKEDKYKNVNQLVRNQLSIMMFFVVAFGVGCANLGSGSVGLVLSCPCAFFPTL